MTSLFFYGSTRTILDDFMQHSNRTRLLLLCIQYYLNEPETSATAKTSNPVTVDRYFFYLFQHRNSKNTMYDINLDHVTAELSNQVKWPTVPSVNGTFRTILGVRRSLTPLLSLLVVAACLYVAEEKIWVRVTTATSCNPFSQWLSPTCL